MDFVLDFVLYFCKLKTNIFFFTADQFKFCRGVADSLKNIFVIFYLDKEMNKKIEAKAAKTSSVQTTNANEPVKRSNKEKKKSKKLIHVRSYVKEH